MNQPRVPSLCFFYGRRISGIEEILEVFLLPPNNILSRGQQLPTSTVNSVGGGLLPPPETPSSNFAQTQAFVSATACAAAHLACQ